MVWVSLLVEKSEREVLYYVNVIYERAHENEPYVTRSGKRYISAQKFEIELLVQFESA